MAEQLIYVGGGLSRIVVAMRAAELPTWEFGLFQNDFSPAIGNTIAQIDPCDFSGYAGLFNGNNWTVPVLSGLRAYSSCDPIYWLHNGGPVANWVYGFYVVDVLGELVAAQRLEGGPALMDGSGQAVLINPIFSQRSEF